MLSSDYKTHFRENFFLAYPVVLSQLGHILVSVVDSIMVGRTGTLPLAAASLGNSIFTVVMVFGMGLSLSITPLVAGAHGRNNKKRISLLMINSVLVCSAAGLLLFLSGYLISPLLLHLNQPANVVELAIPYLHILCFSMLPLMVFQGFRQFAEGLSLTKQSMYISIFANALNVVGNYMLIYGKWGAPALGLNGAAISTMLSRVVMAFIMGYFVLNAEILKTYRLRWKRKFISGKHMIRIIKLGWPISLQMAFEVGAFSFSAIMIGWLGAKALAAHQIAISIASLTYMMAGGIATAATIRVGNLFGRGQVTEMQKAGYSSLLMAVVFMTSAGLILILLNNFIPHLYVKDPEVIKLAGGLLIIAALFQISDGVQVVGLGALRGLEDVKIPSMISLLAYWVVALPIGYVFGFVLNGGASGIWTGLLFGLTVAAILLFFRFRKLSLEK
ncbi:MATE family efflux transporter [Adhaeribacter rhizoryzae]|uniref:Multidrug-efflux transporter n=1 Tax=Adhaeribacter rhizoryzae TaxID=2607907 RepID=A0A5M6CWN1_9BACT|nr:MATE family efflux transporter [Adhaeribacter rhizoryzae]KAA5539376.1 MATE family efflux transporter [Adhaeribacter rhizoryzae]